MILLRGVDQGLLPLQEMRMIQYHRHHLVDRVMILILKDMQLGYLEATLMMVHQTLTGQGS